nr:unnamed protein product [Callosobruchus analis]
MKCYLCIIAFSLVLITTSGWKNSTTRKKWLESRSDTVSTTRGTGKLKNNSVYRPAAKSGGMITIRGKRLISENNLYKKHKISVSDPKQRAGQNSDLDRSFVNNTRSKNSVLDKRNIAVTKENETKSHTTTVEARNITTARSSEGGECYPTYSSGGVGQNFVEFDVLTQYGKGFKVFVQIFGYRIEEAGKKVEQNEDKDRNNTVDSGDHSFEK